MFLFCSHTKWWTDKLLASLPLPQNEHTHTHTHTHTNTHRTTVSLCLYTVEDEDETIDVQPVPMETDSFDEVYKPFELTDFDSLLAKNIGRPIE